MVKIKCIMMYKKKSTWFPYTPSMDEEIDKQTNIIGDENVKIGVSLIFINSNTKQNQWITKIIYSDEHMNKRGG